MPLPPDLSYLGIAKEAVPGTGLPSTNFLPIVTRAPFDNQMYLEDKAFRGSMVDIYELIAGVRHAEWDLGGPVFADAVGWPLMGVLGDVTVSTGRTVADAATTNASPTLTSATAAFNAADVGRTITGAGIPAATTILTVTNATTITMSANATATAAGVAITIGTVGVQIHQGAVKNSTDGQPNSYTFDDYYGIAGAHTRQYAGMKFSDVGLKWQATGLLEWTAKALGIVSALVAKDTSSFSGVTATPAWRGVTTIAGVGNVLLESGEFNFKRTATPLHTVQGIQDPYKIWVSRMGLAGKLTFIMEDDAELIRYLTNTQPSLDVTFAAGAGATATSIGLHSTKCGYKVAKQNFSKDYVALDVDWTGKANTTDAGASGGFSQAKISIANALAAGTYA
jgi:Phage tail tube protein